LKPNLPILTGLGFFAAFYVFIFHIDLRLPLTVLGKTISYVIAQGAVGVNVFFILSGFILFYNYHDKKVNFVEFILKRLAKIYPVYLAGFVVCFLVVEFMHIKVDNFFEVMMMNLLLVQSYLPKFSMQWYGGGSWSISTEFFFYLCFPLLLNFILKLSKTQIFIFLFLSFFCSVFTGILLNLKMIDFQLSYSFPPSRIWEFIIGMLTAALVVKHKVTINNLLILAVAIFSIYYYYYIGYKLLGYVIQNIILVPLMITILISVSTRKKHVLSFLGNRFFEYLGKVSYSFYIVQIPIMILLEKNIGFKIYNTSITFSLIFFTNLLGAIILYHIIESPLHQFLNKKIKHIFVKKTTSLT